MTSKVPQHTVSPMGESALLVSWGNRVNANLNALIHHLVGLLRDSHLRGVRDMVPGYSSVLIVYDHDVVSDVEVEAWIGAGITNLERAENRAPDGGKHHRIPVQYGGEHGPDLEALAAQEGVTPGKIVKMHTEKAFQVAFLGFLPGFAYMGRLPRRKPVTRLSTPRARVPSGSVGMAGFQTGIYPFASPGGWRIIGRTGLSIWDPNSDSPARFAPGDSVQFIESRYEPEPPEYRPATPTTARPALEVVHAGGISVIQDPGRAGLMHLGVGEGGAFDGFAARRANTLVGNEPEAAVLEIAFGGPELRVTSNITIAMDGADFQCRADTALIPPRLSWFARSGTTLRFVSSSAASAGGMRAYLAVSGGFDVPRVLGSRSTSLLAGFGGYDGRALRGGDFLGVGDSRGVAGMISGRYWLGRVRDISPKKINVRFVPFRGLQATRPSALRQFVDTVWLMTEQADRMGLRLRTLDSTSLPVSRGELASFGVVSGVIQLPPSGQPVVLGPDCQTTGGYPLLGTVIRADMPLLAQAVTGAHIRFVPVGVEEARSALRQENSELLRGLELIRKDRNGTG